MLQWEQLKSEFLVEDSNLRDIYVLQTTVDDWQELFDKLKTIYQLHYSVDGNAQLMPDSITAIFAVKATASPTVSFALDKITVASHFFTPEELDFDISAREINSQKTLDTLLDFLKTIGDATQKRVILTYENFRKYPMISYDPNHSAMRYHPKKT